MNKNNSIELRSSMKSKLDLINLQLEKLKKQADKQYKTNGEFRYNPLYTGGNPIIIYKENNIGVLLSVLGSLKGHYDNYNEAAKELNLSTYPSFIWCGYTYDDWKNDILIRYSVVTHHEKQAKLKEAKRKLEHFLTEDDRLSIALREVETLIDNEPLPFDE